MTDPNRKLVTLLILVVPMFSVLTLPLVHGAPTTYTIDWALSSPSLSPSSPKAGDSVTFSVVAKQVSSNWQGSLVGVWVTVKLDGNGLETVFALQNQPGPVPAGFTKTVTTKPWTATVGIHQVTWTLGFAGGDETVILTDPSPNNDASLQFSVASGSPVVQSLSAGSWWSDAGSYSWDLSGTGSYNGKYREDGTHTAKYTVLSSDLNTIVIRYSHSDSWTCSSSGGWASVCQPNKGTYSEQIDYTIEVTTLRVIDANDASSPENAKDEVGHPTWMLLSTNLSVGDTASGGWSVPNGDGISSTYTNVLWKVEKLQKINVKGVDVNVRVLTYTGDHLGGFSWVRNGKEFDSRGSRTESDLYDTVYGIYMGDTTTGSYSFSDSAGSWTETYQKTIQITDTNLKFDSKPAQVSLTLGRPAANVPISVDGVSYAGGQLPKVFTWDAGSTHTLQVDKMILGESGVRYVFIQWSDGSKDASRSITATQSGNLTVTFKTQYELKVESDLGDPQGSGWYDAGSSATFSITSPQPETGLFGSLGGKTVFQRWSGDSTPNTAQHRTAEIVMDSPKTVQAEWTTDNSMPYMILGGIGVAIAVVIILALLLMRRKKPSAQAYPPAYAPAPPPPPTQAKVPFCKNCGKPTTYIEQYQRYYCYNCKQYE